MGNCCKGGSSAMVWAGDDWSDLWQEEDQVGMKVANPTRETRSSADKRGFSPSSSSTSSSERTLTIRMRKKELVKLLDEVNMKGMPLEQAMARLTAGGDDDSFAKNNHHRTWRPALPSIPEVS